jgi:hypothetical protein
VNVERASSRRYASSLRLGSAPKAVRRPQPPASIAFAKDITAALELLENRPERTMSARPLHTQSRIRVALESDQR